jgi:peroxiredoxin
MMAGAACVLFAALTFGESHTSAVPRKAPDFNILMNNAAPLSLGSYKGKVIALCFLLTYCPHCQKTVGVLSKLQPEYGAKGLQVVGSAIEDAASLAVPDFIKKFQPPFPVGFNERNSVLDFLQHPVIFQLMMPQLVLIDRKGIIRAQFAGDDALFTGDQEKGIRERILPLLQEPRAAVAAPRAASKEPTLSRR